MTRFVLTLTGPAEGPLESNRMAQAKALVAIEPAVQALVDALGAQGLVVETPDPRFVPQHERKAKVVPGNPASALAPDGPTGEGAAAERAANGLDIPLLPHGEAPAADQPEGGQRTVLQRSGFHTRRSVA